MSHSVTLSVSAGFLSFISALSQVQFREPGYTCVQDVPPRTIRILAYAMVALGENPDIWGC
jgi:hypothetical protein